MSDHRTADPTVEVVVVDALDMISGFPPPRVSDLSGRMVVVWELVFEQLPLRSVGDFAYEVENIKAKAWESTIKRECVGYCALYAVRRHIHLAA